MTPTARWNFAGRLVERLGGNSQLIDAPTGEVVTAAELPAAVARFAAAFSSLGLRFGDRILIACNLSPESSLAYLGALFGGFVAVPLTESALAASGETLALKTGARALWTEWANRCDWAERIGLARISGRPSAHPAGIAPAPCHEDDLAALMATSGSTGAPRLVKVSHGNLIANTEAIIRSQRLGADERGMLILPVSYCFGASVLHTHLYQGGSVVFDSRFMFPDKVLHAIGRYGCTTFAGVPTAYSILLRRSNIRIIPLAPLRRFLQAGGALTVESVRQMREIVPHAEFFVMYGQTEATSRISCLPPDRLADKAGSVGLPLDNLAVRVVDSAGEEAAPGQSGELWVSGKSISAGYYDEPEETEHKFRDGWLLTGDIAARDRDGFLWITGRKSEFIKIRGIRVGFAEIEARIAAFPGVAECAATAVPHVEAGEALALYVVATEGASDLAASIRRGLPSEWTCDSVNLVEELPRNSHGKLMRSKLAEMACRRTRFA
ncbi:MAG TPA: class I adenylate-forming enzyme family protein [Steroidobacteraceae bacterium]|nr:class I adenylate-forming enzyme family protein [Steroidobacteraceae bacterium]